MTTNPNPRGWRSDWKFVDLNAVQAAWISEGALYLSLANGAFVQAGSAASTLVALQVTPDEASSFFNALEIYRSER